ncbi:hypothetical protein [Mycobacterium sp. UM_3]|uniref:hypothetical protein n=1 Tax=Mycobacterium sp. UM_3 TaxID=1638774 RepID=UPI0012E32981|nr:hypothetical protein [Mycobacterium sp. UM_3]
MPEAESEPVWRPSLGSCRREEEEFGIAVDAVAGDLEAVGRGVVLARGWRTKAGHR